MDGDDNPDDDSYGLTSDSLESKTIVSGPEARPDANLSQGLL